MLPALFTAALLLLVSYADVVHAAPFAWTRMTDYADWPARQMGAVECYPTTLTFTDRNGVSRTVPPNGLVSTGWSDSGHDSITALQPSSSAEHQQQLADSALCTC
jgi:hypothetical protein